MASITIIDNDGLCTPPQLDILQDSTSLNFHLGKYNSLADILNSLRVEVYIRKGIIERNMESFLNEADKFWKSKLEKNPNFYVKEPLGDIIKSEYLRGRYLPETKTIELFPEEMQQEYDGKKMDELLVSTLAHETMHAYFDRPGHERYPYVCFVEEPLAEFGMLLYLEACEHYMLSWAYDDVAGKHNCYRYGATLFDSRGNLALRKYFENYKCGICEYGILDVDGRTPTAISPTPVSSGTFDFTHKTGVISSSDPRIFVTIPKVVMGKYHLNKGDVINLSYYNKSGDFLFSGEVSIIRNRCLNFKTDIKTKFINHYDKIKKIPFGYSIINRNEWQAREL